MAKSVVGGASASVASVFARLLIQGSFTVHAASARSGSVPHLMGKPATVRSATLEMTQYTLRCHHNQIFGSKNRELGHVEFHCFSLSK